MKEKTQFIQSTFFSHVFSVLDVVWEKKLLTELFNQENAEKIVCTASC